MTVNHEAIARLARDFRNLPRHSAVTVLVNTTPPSHLGDLGDPQRLILVSVATPEEALDAMRTFSQALPPPPGDWALEVPEYAITVAERLEAIRDTLEAGRNMAPVRREAFEREAASLGAALGSILARVLLEQRRGES